MVFGGGFGEDGFEGAFCRCLELLGAAGEGLLAGFVRLFVGCGGALWAGISLGRSA